MVDKNEISDNVFKYLSAFIEGSDSLIDEGESVIDEDSQELQKLKALINDLRADRMQLQ